MIPISTAVSSGFTWSTLSGNRGFELKLNGEVVGTVKQPSFWASEVVAETKDGSWSVRRGGWLGSGAAILDSASQQPVATFKASWGGPGDLTFTDGQTFQVKCSGWWRPVWSVVTEAGQPVLSLHIREKSAEVVNAPGLPQDRLSLLMLFVLYRVRQAEQDAASAAVVAACS